MPGALNTASAFNTPIDVIMPSFPPGAANVAGVQTLSAEMPASWDFWTWRFQTSNVALSMIQEFRVFVNGSLIVRISGAMWDLVNQFDRVQAFAGSASTKGVLIWNWRRMASRGGSQALVGSAAAGYQLESGAPKDMDLFSSLNAGSLDNNGLGITSLRVEFDLVNTDPANAPTIACIAQASSPTPGGSGYVRRFEYQTPQVSANTNYQANKSALQFGDQKHQLLNRLHLFPASGTMDTFVVRHNGVQKRVRTNQDNDAAINQGYLHVSQSGSGMYTMAFDENNYADEMLAIGAQATDLQVSFTPSVTGNVNILEDSLGFL